MEKEKIWSESELLLPALRIIANSKEGIGTTDLINRLMSDLKPEGKDLELLKNRKDTCFSQKVRNLISHKKLLQYIDIRDKLMFINPNGLRYLDDQSDDDYSANLGEDNDDFRDENSGYVPPNQSIDLDNAYYSVSDLKRRYDRFKDGQNKHGALRIDPEFQREGGIWSNKSKSLFIESLILHIPIPSIFVYEKPDGVLEVIDGRQRLSTIFDFINGKFSLIGLSILSNLNRKKYSDLVGDLEEFQSRFEDRSLNVVKVRSKTDDTLVIEIFERVNTKGMRLNAQEIRNAVYNGKSTSLLKDISSSYPQPNAIADQFRMKDKYLILRFFAMHNYYNDYVGKKRVVFKSISDYLASVMKKMNDMDDQDLNIMKQNFNYSYSRAKTIFGDSAFKLKASSPINMIMFEVTLLLTLLLKNKEDQVIVNALSDFKNSKFPLFYFEFETTDDSKDSSESPFEKNIKYHRDSRENIEQRIKWIHQIVMANND